MKCENCNSEITFWVALKQPTPFRFKCPECKVKYKISTPRMGIIAFGVVMLFSALTIGLCFGAKKLGIAFALPYSVLLIIGWLILEAWTNNYISKYGIFTRR